MGVVNQMGKSSSSSLKNRKKIFKNRIKGFEKKFYELRTLCNVEAAGVLNSEYLRNGAGVLPENSKEFDEVLMRYNHYKIYGNKNKIIKDQKLCPKNIDNLCVESLSGIERDLESMFVMITEKENLLKGVISSSSSSNGLIPYCDQGEKKTDLGVLDSACYNNAYDYTCPSSSKGSILNCDQNENFGVFDSTCLIGSSNYDYASTSSSSDFNQVQQMITLPTAANDMEMGCQRLNCSYVEMMNTTSNIDGLEFLLC